LMAEAERHQLIKSYGTANAFILDEFLEPVPIGVKGDLYIGDRTITQGFLHSGEQTNERFIQSPFEECPRRLYQTGDAARYLPDGNIDLIKVDRKDLRPPGNVTLQTRSATEVLPRTNVEKALAEIWRTLLKLPRVGIHDSFFRIGGHSLLAIRVVSRIRDAFQIDFQMSSLFETPTIAQLAPVVERQIIEQLQQLTEEEAEILCGQVA
jgi:acyl carrier protein